MIEKVKHAPIPDEVFLQPWFLPKNLYTQIRRMLPSCHLLKMRYYFDDYGCLRCGAIGELYGSNGLCDRCSYIVRARVMRCLIRRFKKVGVNSPGEPIAKYLGGNSKLNGLGAKMKPGAREHDAIAAGRRRR